jgi:pimeloyl-ACP methyl ester carboxylesterase
MLPNGVAPMTIELDAGVVDDLEERVRNARRPEQMLVVGREDAARLAFISDLIGYWASTFDWRSQERRLNELPHFRVTVAGINIHFLWLRSPAPGAAPLLLANGWPSCFLEYVDVLEVLSNGEGARSAAFDLVVPTMPGYGLSEPALDRRIDEDVVADLWVELMRRLGYASFYAHGDDFGGSIASRIAWRHPEAVAALHITECLSPKEDGLHLRPAERRHLEAVARWREDERAYGAIAATRPQTLALALDDSPIGLAAWMTDKYLSWSDPATVCAWTPERILGFVTLYWSTRCIGPSMRLYANAPSVVPDRPIITCPTAVITPRESRPAPPREWTERTYADIRVHSRRERGGHFMAIEHPEGFVEELRSFFSQLE